MVERNMKIELLEQYLKPFNSKGIIEWIGNSGYYDAPASSNHHGAYKGALLDHSFEVTYQLIKLTDKLGLKWSRKESPRLVGMLHDLCKIDAYILEEDGTYSWNKNQPIDGHGEKSCIYALTHMDLTDEEIMCIRYHMGAFTDAKEWKNYSNAVRKYPNVLYTHTADMIASQIKGV